MKKIVQVNSSYQPYRFNLVRSEKKQRAAAENRKNHNEERMKKKEPKRTEINVQKSEEDKYRQTNCTKIQFTLR